MARRPWLYTENGENQIGGFVKEFTNIAFLTVKVGPEGSGGQGWGCGWVCWIPRLQSGLGGVSWAVAAPQLHCQPLSLSYRELATWCPQTGRLLPSPCSAASLRTSLTKSCRGSTRRSSCSHHPTCPHRRHLTQPVLTAAWLYHGPVMPAAFPCLDRMRGMG